MKKGMISVSVLFPNGDGKTFDMDYYCDKHVPMVAGLLGDFLKGATIDRAIGGGMPASPAPYVVIGNLFFDSIEAFERSFGSNAGIMMADLPNFTNIEPVIQISEVIIWQVGEPAHEPDTAL